jgi:hypothetical protein
MGFEKYIVKNDKLTVERDPGWYALQTITHTFYNRDQFTKPSFDVSSSEKLTMLRAYEHKVNGGSELLLMLWNDGKQPKKTTISISSDGYRYPVRIDNFKYEKWLDVPYSTDSGHVQIDLEVVSEPVILRLVKTD